MSGALVRFRAARWLLAVLLLTGCRDAVPARVISVPGGDARRGRALVADFGCGGCHTIPGIPGAYGGVGPPLEALAGRTFIAGRFRNEPLSLVRWIQLPQQLVPGTAMPTLGVTESQARDIAAYLYARGSDGLGPPHLLPPSVLGGE